MKLECWWRHLCLTALAKARALGQGPRAFQQAPNHMAGQGCAGSRAHIMDKPASREDSFLLKLPQDLSGPGHCSAWCPEFLPAVTKNLFSHSPTPNPLDPLTLDNRSTNAVSFCLESIFLHSESVLGHDYLMLTFSPYTGIWLFYEIAHSHLFNLKSIRQKLHSE